MCRRCAGCLARTCRISAVPCLNCCARRSYLLPQYDNFLDPRVARSAPGRASSKSQFHTFGVREVRCALMPVHQPGNVPVMRPDASLWNMRVLLFAFSNYSCSLVRFRQPKNRLDVVALVVAICGGNVSEVQVPVPGNGSTFNSVSGFGVLFSATTQSITIAPTANRAVKLLNRTIIFAEQFSISFVNQACGSAAFRPSSENGLAFVISLFP